jgi:S-(hydroxymethyl)glutathione dehydrogenase / alcohol dehydrogenase
VRALVLNRAPGQLELADLKLTELGPHEVLVRTAAAGLCHSDLHCLEGALPAPLPVVMGHEGSGIVEQTGDAVTEVRAGDHVVTCLSAACGACEFCQSGRPFLCMSPEVHRVGLRSYWREAEREAETVGQYFGIGSFAEQMVVHERSLVAIPGELPLDRAAILGCAVVTGVGAVCRTAAVPVGATVAVLGCGGVGLNCVQGAVLASASRIIAIDVEESRLAMAQSLGATDIINARSDDVVRQVRGLVPGGVEYSFEAVGSPETVPQAVAMLRPGGIATIVGLGTGGARVSLGLNELVTRGKRVQGSVMGSTQFKVDIPRYAQLYASGRLKLDELITGRISLADGDAALRSLHDGSGVRTVIDFEGNR